jgi:hypothetical protein
MRRAREPSRLLIYVRSIHEFTAGPAGPLNTRIHSAAGALWSVDACVAALTEALCSEFNKDQDDKIRDQRTMSGLFCVLFHIILRKIYYRRASTWRGIYVL